jgi:hypothetical protein
MTKRVIAVLTVGLFLVFFTQACTIKLNGASTQGLKTINVGYFENNAQLVVGNLSQNFVNNTGRGGCFNVGKYYWIYNRTRIYSGYQ